MLIQKIRIEKIENNKVAYKDRNVRKCRETATKRYEIKEKVEGKCGDEK